MSYIKKIYFPLPLKSTSRIINIGKTISIRRIDDIICQRALGIKEVLYDFDNDGTINKVSKGKGYSMIFALHMPPIERGRVYAQFANINLLNYVLVVNKEEEARNVQCALKLINCWTKSGISVGLSYARGGHFLHFLNPEPYFGKELFELNKASVKSLTQMVTQLSKLQEDKKLQLILQKYQYALSSERLLNSQRFLEMAIILEMLLLPKQNAELRYRFSLRLAKLFNKYDGQQENSGDLYGKAKTLYDIRSKIVHEGYDDRIEKNMEMLTLLTQRALLLYLSDTSIFTETALDNLCLS